MLDWFDASEAATAGSALADQFAKRAASHLTMHSTDAQQREQATALRELLRRAERDARIPRLNVYKKARLANSFKWRLIENGVEPVIADEVTQALVVHLSHDSTRAPGRPAGAQAPRSVTAQAKKQLLAEGNKHFARGAYVEAVASYQELIELDSGHAYGLNNLGAALWKLGRYVEAEQRFRQAIDMKPDHAEAHCNLGNALRSKGGMAQAQISLQRALKLKPGYLDAQISLGMTLVFLGRLRDAKVRFEKILKTAPRQADALFGMGQIARLEGRFKEAEAIFKRVLRLKPEMPSAWAALPALRKMTSADGDWLEGARRISAKGIDPLEEANLRFSIGKYCDDVQDFEQAFREYERANELRKTLAEKYDRRAHSRLVDDLIGGNTREALATMGEPGSASMKPVFVVGMMRSGTSLTEQIIASHPAAKGAGELGFWSDAVQAHEKSLRQGVLPASIRKELAEAYLDVLATYSADASRIVDKAPVNSDHLGVIHSVFPNARIIYMRRDPIDTGLSCYFQPFSAALNFTLDLSDLAFYYREHQRLMLHWRSVLPPGTILDVPYEELVTNQDAWTRKILDFLGLEWDDKCLDFHNTQRLVASASYWQVRQKIYKTSVGRWRNYEKHIGPLKSLID